MSNPQLNRGCVVIFSRDESMAVERFICRVGFEEARLRLGVSARMLETARDEGRVERRTKAKILEALAREEATA